MHNSVIVRLQLRSPTFRKDLRSATADAKHSQCIICTKRTIIIQFKCAVTIISVFVLKFNSKFANAVKPNGMRIASCNAAYTILHLAQGSKVTLVFYKHLVYNK